MPATSNNTIKGIWLMVLAMGAFAIADTLIKLATAQMAVSQIIFLLIGGGLVIFVVLAVYKRETLLHRAAFAPIMFARYAAEVVGTFGMIKSLSVVDLTTVGAIMQATPLVVAAGAVLFLGEVVSWRRWAAILVGFGGVLLIIRPGAESYDANMLWPLLAMMGLAGRDLTTRLAPTHIGSATLSAYTMIAALPFAIGFALLDEGQLIAADIDLLLSIAMISFGALGYLLMTAALRMADASAVSPFRYARLLFLLILGVAFFGERPDALTLLGAAIIIASGIYTMWRDRLVKNAA